jgi:hypothetical protein
MEPPYRVYIDESGDHRYQHLDDLSGRYLGLTGLVIRKAEYDPDRLERLKRDFFTYDPDLPPILTRKHIMDRKGCFGVLCDANLNARWEAALLDFYTQLPAQIFTVVIDKKIHFDRYSLDAWNPYNYSLAVAIIPLTHLGGLRYDR